MLSKILPVTCRLLHSGCLTLKIFTPLYNEIRILQHLVQIKPEDIIRVPYLIISLPLSWASKEFNISHKQIRTASPKMQYIIIFTDTVTILTLKYILDSCVVHVCWRKVTGNQESSYNVPPRSPWSSNKGNNSLNPQRLWTEKGQLRSPEFSREEVILIHIQI